jgi:hypothetical protein
LTFDEAVFDERALPFLNSLFELAGCQGLLVGEREEVLELNGFCASRVKRPILQGREIPPRPVCWPPERKLEAGDPGDKLMAYPIRHEGEPLALLIVPEPGQELDLEASDKVPLIIEMIQSYLELKHNQRMIAEVHHDSLEISYREQIKKNQELMASEKRYRQLAETLEIRVQQRKKELEQAQQQLIHQEKMASIGQLAAGVAHEINNPNGFVHSNLATLKNYLKHISIVLDEYRKVSDEPGEKNVSGSLKMIEKKWKELDIDYILSDLDLLIEHSIKGTQRITKIVNGLSRFSHVDKKEVEIFDLNSLLENTLELLQNEIKHKVELVKELGELPKIKGLPGQITQVLVNLIVNALQAIPGYGRLFVSTRLAGGFIELTIRDNGMGISEEHLSRLFDPFFTTKPVGQGTGLGLSISYEIIKNHGGEIRVSSTPGEGSTFVVSIPRTGRA